MITGHIPFFRSFAILFLSLIFFTSCTTMTKQECQSANWFFEGKRDGRKGKPTKEFLSKSRACQKHNIPADEEAYLNGRAEGLIEFCTLANGTRSAIEGYEYNGVCPKSLEAEFLKGYAPARQEYLIKQQQAELDQRQSELEQRERKLKQQEEELQQQEQLRLQESAMLMQYQPCALDSQCVSGRCGFKTFWLKTGAETKQVCEY